MSKIKVTQEIDGTSAQRPTARVDHSCDAWNGKNAFKAHLTAAEG